VAGCPIIGLQIGGGSATIVVNATRAIHLQRLIDASQIKFFALRGLEVVLAPLRCPGQCLCSTFYPRRDARPGWQMRG
jgi:hypothetical protein